MRNLLPEEDIIYFGDTAHLPYGEKSPEAIRQYALGITQFLLENGAKAIVIACNSASSVAGELLLETVPAHIPVINVIDPVVQSIDETNSNIGIIGTRATIASHVYQSKIHKKFPELPVEAMATPLLVPIIEEGLEASDISRSAAEHYLNLPALKDIDTLIPGCTHYPLLTGLFKQILGEGVTILNTPEIVAQEVQRALSRLNLLESDGQSGKSEFYVSDYTPTFERISRHFFGEDIHLEEKDIWKPLQS